MLNVKDFCREELVKECMNNDEFVEKWREVFRFLILVGGLKYELIEWELDCNEDLEKEKFREWVEFMRKKFGGDVEEFLVNL